MYIKILSPRSLLWFYFLLILIFQGRGSVINIRLKAEQLAGNRITDQETGKAISEDSLSVDLIQKASNSYLSSLQKDPTSSLTWDSLHTCNLKIWIFKGKS